VNDCYPISNLPQINPKIKRKLEDAIIVSTALSREGLSREGLEPNASDNRGRILRTYMRSLIYLRERAGLSEEDITTALNQFEHKQFSDKSIDAASKIAEYLRDYEQEILTKGAKSPEDKIVLSALNRNNE
jgi:hypothetical protein